MPNKDIAEQFRLYKRDPTGFIRASDERDSSAYLAALEKAAYNDSGRAYGQGLDAITRYLAGAGPLADSGAATALKYKLASQVYGKARSGILGGYADFIRQSIQARKAYEYQRQLLKYQKELNRKGPLDYLAGFAGGIVPGLGSLGGGQAGGLDRSMAAEYERYYSDPTGYGQRPYRYNYGG